MRPGMLRITLDVILRAVFGVRDEERMDRFRETIPRVADATSPLDVIPILNRDFGRWSPAARMRRALADSDRLIYEELALRRAEESAEERDDVLSMLLAARDEDGKPMSDVWIPFGGGVRRCIGAAFAQTEMKVVLREVLRRVRLRADRPRPERPRVRHVTVVPARGARVVVTSQRTAAASASASAASYVTGTALR